MDMSFVLKTVVIYTVFSLTEADPFLVWSQHDKRIERSKLLHTRGNLEDLWGKGHTYSVLHTDANAVLFGALAADPHLNNTVFAHDRISGNIYLMDVANTKFSNTWKGASAKINDLAVDWLNKNLYYSDPSLGVGLYSYKKEPYFAIVLKGSSFNGIAVDPTEDYLFVIDESGRRILRSSLAGNSRSVIVSGLRSPALLVADIQTKSVIWIDVGLQVVQKADYDGQNLQTLWNSYTIDSEAFSGITVYEDYLLMAVTKRPSYVVRNKTDGDFIHEEKILNVSSLTQYGLTVVDTDVQQLTQVPCSRKDNGGCAHICTSGGTGRTRQCLCQFGFTLGLDGASCLWAPLMDNFLLLMDDHAGQLYQVDLKTQSVHALQMSAGDDAEADAVVYDPVDHQVYWTEWKLKQIRRLNLLTKQEDIFFSLDTSGASQGLALDVQGRHLYYSDVNNKIIGRISIRDKQHTTILRFSSHEKPLRIQLDETEGILYCTEWGIFPKIEKANMKDGSERQVLATGNLKVPSGLALDSKAKHLYWVDNNLNRLERVNTDGTSRQFIMTPPCSPFTLTLDQTHIYIGCLNEIIKIQKETWTVTPFGPKTFWHIFAVHLYSSSESNSGSSPTTSNPNQSTSTAALPDRIVSVSTRTYATDDLVGGQTSSSKTHAPDDLTDGQTSSSERTTWDINSEGGNNESQTSETGNLPLIIGVVVAGVIVLAIIIAVAVVVVKTRNKRATTRQSQIHEPGDVRYTEGNAYASLDRPDSDYLTPQFTGTKTGSELCHSNGAFRKSDTYESID